jgi:phosphatidylserine/phosphatidylglycerophosphate/cardiolipin synthase-like enzyme
MSLSPDSEQLIKQWLSNLRSHASESVLDDPRYYLYRPQSLITSSQPQSFLLGTGEQISANIFSAFESAQHEILFVTCFWAHSASQAAFASALKALSARAIASDRRIRVRIGFSSCSLWQKLTQTSSLSGKIYPPLTWPGTFGLPAPAELQGLDITVRSIFVWPLSVMHSKFVICDRERLFLPSCNVSWEEWFEGCIELRGEIVAQTLLFWESFWGRDKALAPLQATTHPVMEGESLPARSFLVDPEVGAVEITAPDQCSHTSLAHLGTIPTILLPSPHHRNPCFRPSPFFSVPPPPPPTPLNTFLLTIFGVAKRSIYVQSPNITSQPVLDAILAALQRGVNVRIISNRRMQVTEQIVTAGRLTEWALEDLWRGYTSMRSLSRLAGYLDDERDLEAGPSEHGTLEISYYQPPPRRTDDRDAPMLRPVKSHIKLTVVDEEIVVLGSGNMDRASWYTSQELGVTFFSRELAAEVMKGVQEGLEGCLENVIVTH